MMEGKDTRILTFAVEEFPSGWTKSTIAGTIGRDGVFVDGDWVETKDQDPNGDVRLVQLADIGDGVYRDRSARYLTRSKAIELKCTFLKPNDVLVARMPDPLGRACLFPGDRKQSVTAVDVCIIRTGRQGAADHQWFIFALNSPQFRSSMATLASGRPGRRAKREVRPE